jgi:hypothetical protein
MDWMAAGWAAGLVLNQRRCLSAQMPYLRQASAPKQIFYS